MAITAGISQGNATQALTDAAENLYTAPTSANGEGVEAFRVGVVSTAAAGAFFWIDGDTSNKTFVEPGQSTIIKSYRSISTLDADGDGAASEVYWSAVVER